MQKVLVVSSPLCYSMAMQVPALTTTPAPTGAPLSFDPKSSLARVLVDPRWKSKGPTMAEFIKNPRPLMRGGRDVS